MEIGKWYKTRGGWQACVLYECFPITLEDPNDYIVLHNCKGLREETLQRHLHSGKRRSELSASSAFDIDLNAQE